MPFFGSKKGVGVGAPTAASTGLTLVPSTLDMPDTPVKPARLNKYGLHLLNPQPEDTSPGTPPSLDRYPIDIVAIHGLRGDAYDSWTDKNNGAFWLRDFLPKEFPGARIFSFGYAADVWSRGGAGTVEWYGRSLMQSLKGVRCSAKEKRRPIIFICHSMGGIVVKQAIITAKIDSREFEEISRATAAILFLATPHCGSNTATIFKTIAAIANTSNPGTRIWGKVELQHFKTLEKDSKHLQEISRNFRNQIGSIKIASFVEGKCERGAKERIVDEGSGFMNIDGEELVHMTSSDHRGICRFPTKDDDSYRNVFRVLLDCANLAVHKVVEDLTSEELPCLHSLAFPEIDQRRHDADRAQHDTCSWILRHPSYRQWQQGSQGLLWIKGKPGSGKSTLMAFIYRHFQTPGNHLTLNFFFHGRGTEMQKSEEGMFRSLVHSLFLNCYEARAPIMKAFNSKKAFGTVNNGWGWQLKELQELFFTVVTQISKKREVTIFVDALDEAGSETAAKLLRYFHHLNEEFISMDCWAKLCISCRHYPVISLIPGVKILVEDENETDIRTVVGDQLFKHVEIRDYDPNFLENRLKLLNTIVARSSGLFQWVSLVVPMAVVALNDGQSFDEVHQLLGEQSSELFTLYQDILKNIVKVRNSKITLRLMQWVCLAARPLSLTELRFALACDESLDSSELTPYEEREGFIESDERMELLTKSLSGGLLEVKYSSNVSVVQPVHQSVNDFLVSGGLGFLSSISYSINENTAGDTVGFSHQLLSRSCVNYLKVYQPRFPAILKPEKWTKETYLQMEQAAKRVLHELPFLDYATKSLFVHAEKAESHGTPQQNIVQQFNTTPQLFNSWKKAYEYLDPYSPKCPTPGSTLIHSISSSNLPSAIQTLLESGVPTHEQDHSKRQPLHFAARWGHIELLQLLLKNGAADISAQDSGESTALDLASGHGHVKAVKLLLHKGARVNQSTGYSGSALQHAAAKGNMGVVRVLLEAGADVNAQGGLDANALHAAAYRGSEDIVRVLLEQGARVNAQGGFYGNALQAAASHESKGCLGIVRMLLSRGAEVNARGGYYGTALQAAAANLRESCLEIVRMLVRKGAEINGRGGYYGTALQAAVRNHSLHSILDTEMNVVRFLLDGGADVRITGGRYENALQAAAASFGANAVQVLLERGARFNVSGPDSFDIAVQGAAYEGNEELVKSLLGKSENLRQRDFLYKNLFRVAMRLRYRGVAELLVANGGVDMSLFDVDNERTARLAPRGENDLEVERCSEAVILEGIIDSRSDIS